MKLLLYKLELWALINLKGFCNLNGKDIDRMHELQTLIKINERKPENKR